MGKHTGKSKQPHSDSEYQEFKKKVFGILGYDPDNKYTPWTDTLYVEWRIGGLTGGSCWDEGDEDHHSAVSGDPEPAFEYLDTILEKMYPEITFLQYKILERKCVTTEERSEYEYYGNYSDYRRKVLDLRKLHDFLSSLKKNAED